MRHSKLVGAVSNCAVSTYHGIYAVRGKTAPTGGESVHLFLESTIDKHIQAITAALIYTLRSSGAQELTLSRFYRHIAPLERKVAFQP